MKLTVDLKGMLDLWLESKGLNEHRGYWKRTTKKKNRMRQWVRCFHNRSLNAYVDVIEIDGDFRVTELKYNHGS